MQFSFSLLFLSTKIKRRKKERKIYIASLSHHHHHHRRRRRLWRNVLLLKPRCKKEKKNAKQVVVVVDDEGFSAGKFFLFCFSKFSARVYFNVPVCVLKMSDSEPKKKEWIKQSAARTEPARDASRRRLRIVWAFFCWYFTIARAIVFFQTRHIVLCPRTHTDEHIWWRSRAIVGRRHIERVYQKYVLKMFEIVCFFSWFCLFLSCFYW